MRSHGDPVPNRALLATDGASEVVSDSNVSDPPQRRMPDSDTVERKPRGQVMSRGRHFGANDRQQT